MLFEFPPAIQAGIAAGKYIQVFSSSGIPQSIARDATTGQFVGNAIGFLSDTGIPLNPLAVPLQLITSGLEMYQMHRGFQSVEKVSIRQTLSDARSDYRNTELLDEVSAPGRLRRLECAWAIEQAMISTYQIAGERLAVSDRLTNLDRTIRTDAVEIINHCNSEEELDFIAPEISRIRYHDLEALELWKNQNDWLISLPYQEREDLQNSKYLTSTNTHQYDLDRGEVAEPPESIEQRRLQQSTYPGSMKDRLLFMMDLDRRRLAESYIHDRAIIAGYKNLNSSNLQHATEFAVANLYWYYKDREIGFFTT